MASTNTSTLMNRMIRAAQLDPTLYEEVEADEQATGQAALVVLLAGICGGLGSGLAQMGQARGAPLIVGAVGDGIVALLGWLIWAYLAYWVGTQMFGGTATPGEMLRTLGFAQSAGILAILGFLPLFGWLVRFAVWIWVLVAGVIAVRQALDFSTEKAVLTVIVGWLVSVALHVLFALLLLPFIIAGAILRGIVR